MGDYVEDILESNDQEIQMLDMLDTDSDFDDVLSELINYPDTLQA